MPSSEASTVTSPMSPRIKAEPIAATPAGATSPASRIADPHLDDVVLRAPRDSYGASGGPVGVLDGVRGCLGDSGHEFHRRHKGDTDIVEPTADGSSDIHQRARACRHRELELE